MSTTVIILIVGLLAGTLSSLLGIGGGIILVPGMVFVLGMEMSKAIGTSLAIIIPTAVMGVYRHNLNGNIDWKVCLLIAVGSVTGAYIGAWLSEYLSADVLRKIFVIFMLVTAFRMWRG
ncbi:MAG: sulfite exporter TauE/SafE family protein [Peptococcaceae bacterium]